MANSTQSLHALGRWIIAGLFIGMGSVATTSVAASPVVKLSENAVTVTGFAPGASLALLNVAHEPEYYMMRSVVRHELLFDRDRDGEVQYVPPKGVPFRSIWIVVDIATGETAMAWPEGFRAAEMRQRAPSRGNAVQAIANTLDIGRSFVALLVVRPRVGAWSSNVREGSDTDTDRKNDRKVRVDLSRLRPLDSTFEAPPHALKKGDVVAILDPALMQYWTTTVE